ncbi:hypothetical protein AVBRAN12640_05265 [Campylobacter sp. RM12640]|uniref:hypothetical protein n=1 Tax=unclassified Campylobacter TaxID=2593542 RepID=UPI00301558C3|nr:hypothetical protein [Campylobacter sp. RM12640]MBZ7990044.1 hypothetical protein [Campylobacter sp. RM12635]
MNNAELKLYTKAPLPFQGQKRNFIKEIIELVRSYNDENIIFIDAFGGSGLISNTIKYTCPKARVIWNDYDNYQQRLDNIEQTNEILKRFEFLSVYKKNEKISDEHKELVLKICKEYEEKGYFIDYLTISSQVLFGGAYAFNFNDLKSKRFFCKAHLPILYNTQNYLKNVERVSLDAFELINNYKDNPNAILVLDPPYLQTDTGGYNMSKSWTLAKFLKIITMAQSYRNFIFFSSEKSQALEFFEWANYCNNTFSNLKIIKKTHSNLAGGKARKGDYLFHNLANCKLGEVI